MNDWTTNDGKREIVKAVFKHLRATPEDVPRILDCGLARGIVAKVGDTQIPDDVQVFCLPLGDRLKDGDGSTQQKGLGGSLILEIPPEHLDIESKEILLYACTYSPWRPGEEP
jgi:hypothetical protein